MRNQVLHLLPPPRLVLRRAQTDVHRLQGLGPPRILAHRTCYAVGTQSSALACHWKTVSVGQLRALTERAADPIQAFSKHFRVHAHANTKMIRHFEKTTRNR